MSFMSDTTTQDVTASQPVTPAPKGSKFTASPREYAFRRHDSRIKPLVQMLKRMTNAPLTHGQKASLAYFLS